MIELVGSQNLKNAIYYGSYLYFLAAPLLVWLIMRRELPVKLAAAAVLAVLSVLAYARFVEPRILVTVRHDIEFERCFADSGTLRLAVFSNTHNGMFGNAMPIRRIARRVNSIAPDAVLIPGDFTYFLHPNRFAGTYKALQGIAAPIFGVMGNHDLGLPGPDVSSSLRPTLEALGVSIIDDRRSSIAIRDGKIEVVGLSDLWARHQQRDLLLSEPSRPRVVLTHNPASILELPPDATLDLMISGHTHGGQIYIPYLTCRLMAFACLVTRQGLEKTSHGTVFVTSGTGMVGLPMRFGAPPRIDVLNIRYNACAGD